MPLPMCTIFIILEGESVEYTQPIVDGGLSLMAELWIMFLYIAKFCDSLKLAGIIEQLKKIRTHHPMRKESFATDRFSSACPGSSREKTGKVYKVQIVCWMESNELI